MSYQQPATSRQPETPARGFVRLEAGSYQLEAL